jgi:hypothetical protein
MSFFGEANLFLKTLKSSDRNRSDRVGTDSHRVAAPRKAGVEDQRARSFSWAVPGRARRVAKVTADLGAGGDFVIDSHEGPQWVDSGPSCIRQVLNAFAPVYRTNRAAPNELLWRAEGHHPHLQ